MRLDRFQYGVRITATEADVGAAYQLQGTPDLIQEWQNIGDPVIADDGPLVTETPVDEGEPQWFYRFVILPPEFEPEWVVVPTFDRVRHAFGSGHSQSAEETFHFPVPQTEIEQILMYVRLRCPRGAGCDPWDMFANIRILNSETGEWYEIGRYITPYGVDNSQLEKGFEIDVTDFKSLLTGDVTLRSYIEVWGSEGWLVSVDFEILRGSPEYKYSAVAGILDYADWSLAGVPYGESHNFDLAKNITIPSQAEEVHLRTIISGWGHATPADPGGRRCAEWCFRTHHIRIDGAPTFAHEMGPIGCADNPVQPQAGNWSPDRAGWCPGMAVPVRTDALDASTAGTSFRFAYDFEDWTNDFQDPSQRAFYAISNFVVVHGNEPINPPLVTQPRR